MELIRRAEWGAGAPLGPVMDLPAIEVWLHHSVTMATSDPLADMRTLERIGVDRFGRFSYSFAVHPSGAVLEGAGSTVGAHTGGRNSFSFGIVWIGNYEVDQPSSVQVARMAELVRWLMTRRWLRPGTYPTGGHRDVKATACPGRYAYAQINAIRALAASPPPQKGDIVATIEEMKSAMRAVLNEGTGAGQTSWAGTSKSTLRAVQAVYNRVNSVASAVFDGKPNEIARQVWALKVDNFATQSGSAADLLRRTLREASDDLAAAEVAQLVLAGLSAEQIAAAIPTGIAEAVADKIHERMEG